MSLGAQAYNAREIAAGRVTAAHVTQLAKWFQSRIPGLAIDGKLGPMTLARLERMSEATPEVPPPIPRTLPLAPPPPVHRIARPSVPVRVRARRWRRFDGPLERIPQSRRELVAMLGQPAPGRAGRAWRRQNLVIVRDLPGVHRSVQIHRLIEPYLREGLRRAAALVEYPIDRLGGYCYRHQRHDSGRPLSVHSWGAAVDVDPPDNSPRRFPRGQAPSAWSALWQRIWPGGVPAAFVEAMQSVGFTWGSDWDSDGVTDDHTYLDPMHFELVRRA